MSRATSGRGSRATSGTGSRVTNSPTVPGNSMELNADLMDEVAEASALEELTSKYTDSKENSAEDASASDGHTISAMTSGVPSKEKAAAQQQQDEWRHPSLSQS